MYPATGPKFDFFDEKHYPRHVKQALWAAEEDPKVNSPFYFS
jgi:hypothetical protein